MRGDHAGAEKGDKAELCSEDRTDGDGTRRGSGPSGEADANAGYRRDRERTARGGEDKGLLCACCVS